MTNPIKTIREHVDPAELLAQLAEEAAELTHAALKLRRTYSATNPTTVSTIEAYKQLLEEVADVNVCLNVLGYLDDADMLEIRRVTRAKLDRWVSRLEAKAE